MSFKKLSTILLALLCIICSHKSYAVYLTTVNYYATAVNNGQDTTGWVNSAFTKVTGDMQVSSSGQQEGWSVFRSSPTGFVPAGAVITSVTLTFNITSVGNPGSSVNSLTARNINLGPTLGPTLYGLLSGGLSVNSSTWGNVATQLTLPLTTNIMASLLTAEYCTIGYLQSSGTNVYNITGETGGTALAPRLTITYYVPCTGTPNPGTASATATSVCPTTPFNLNTVGYTNDTGITLTWYKAPSTVIGTGSSITNLTQAATSTYFVRSTCSFSGQSANSNNVTVTEKLPTECYCTPVANSGCTQGDGIHNFTLTGEVPAGIVDVATGCAAGAYDDRTNETVTLMQCVNYTATATKISNNGQVDNIAIWIDFDDNGFFGNVASELVGFASNIGVTATNIPIIMPVGASLGNHRMRVMMGRGGNPQTFDPCNTGGTAWTFGETHDYTATIIPIVNMVPPTVTGPGLHPLEVCINSTLNLTANVPGAPTGTVYIWTGPHASLPITNTTGVIALTNMQLANAGNYTVRAVYGCDTATTVVNVVVDALPVATASSNSPICSGTDLLLHGLPDGMATYVWTGPNNPADVQDPTIANAPVGAAGTYSLVVTDVNGCTSATATTAVVIRTTPNISGTTLTQPTTCVPGNEGRIRLNGLANNTTYSVYYTNPSGTPIGPLSLSSNGSGQLFIDNLTCGTYTNIYVITTTPTPLCTSNIIPSVTLNCVSYTLNTPTLVQPGTCVPGNDGRITICGLPTNNSSWDLFYTKDGNPQSQTGMTTNGSGCLVLNNLTAGSYDNFYAVHNGCTTNTVIGPFVLAVPVYTLTSFTGTNPVHCTPHDGIITGCGLTNGGGYTVVVDSNGTTVTRTNINVNGGCLNITGLEAGTYTNLYIVKGACTSNVMPGPVVLTDPVHLASSLTSNSPLCTGQDLQLTATPPNGVTYDWSGPNAFAPSPIASPVRTSVVKADSGLYQVIIKEVATNCVDTLRTNVIVNQTPSITTVTGTNPTKCNTCNGSLLVRGLDTTVGTYRLFYTPYFGPPINFTSSDSGTYTRTGMCAGNYTQIFVRLNGCYSDTIDGPITLSDPPRPAQPSATATTPICEGDTLKLHAASATYNPAYRWSGPAAFGTNIAGQDQTIPNATTNYTGTYSVTVRDTFNCTSLATTISVTVKAAPVIDVSSNTPVCVGDTLRLYGDADISGTTFVWDYPDGGGSTLDSPKRAPATPAMAGTYTITATGNGCKSVDSTDVYIGNILLAGMQASNNGPLCEGDTLQLSAGVVVPGAQYSWTGPNGYTSPFVNPTRVNISPVTDAGDYSVTAILNGCQSAPSTTTVVINPISTADISIYAVPGDTICAGDNVVFHSNFSNGGAHPQFQWVKNGSWVLGAIDSFYGSPYLYNNDVISVILTSDKLCVLNPIDTSNKITITLATQITPSVILVVNPNVVLPGQPVTFTANVLNAGPNPTFEWFKNGVVIPGATTNTYTTINLSQASDQIKVVVHSSFSCATVDTAVAFWGNGVQVGVATVTADQSVISMYPNPNNGAFTIDGQFPSVNNAKNIPVEVLNSLGQVVYLNITEIVNGVMHMQVSLDDKAAGMYMLRLKIGDDMKMLRFSISH